MPERMRVDIYVREDQDPAALAIEFRAIASTVLTDEHNPRHLRLTTTNLPAIMKIAQGRANVQSHLAPEY